MIVIAICLFIAAGLLGLAVLVPRQPRSGLVDHTARFDALRRALTPKDSL